MVMALAFDDAKAGSFTKVKTAERPETNPGVMTKFFGSKETPDLPHAVLNERVPGRVHVNRTHFHVRDQFQVFTEGHGKLGRHEIGANCVHFTRAYTPYGPLVSGPESGLTFFALRARLDAGGQHLPEEQEQLARATHRQPWQVTRHFEFPELASAGADVALKDIPGMKDEQGLAAYTLSMKPHMQIDAPDPRIGDGQYLVVLRGGFLHDGKLQNAPALVFVDPNDGPFHVHAGPQGFHALVLNFPQVKPRATQAKTPSAAPGFKKWQCTLCSFAYDEALGLPAEGLAAGTRWVDVPDSWTCPDCSTGKSEFQMVEV